MQPTELFLLGETDKKKCVPPFQHAIIITATAIEPWGMRHLSENVDFKAMQQVTEPSSGKVLYCQFYLSINLRNHYAMILMMTKLMTK